MSKQLEDIPTCCCEYKNSQGRLTHILECCCDCEAVDSICDSCIACEPCEKWRITDAIATIMDRLRIPWAGGAGAVQVQLDVFAPIIIIPTLLVLAITHHVVAWCLSVGTPLFLFIYYWSWRRNPRRTRTRFFYSWSLVSIFAMAYIFFGVCVMYREILLYEGMTVLGGFVMMIYTLYLTKQDPGSVRPDHREDSYSRTLEIPVQTYIPNSVIKKSHSRQPSIATLVSEKLDEVKRQQVSNSHSLTHPQVAASLNVDLEDKIAPSPQGHSREGSATINVLQSLSRNRELCSQCNVKIPERATHCTICNQCICVRDHHCIWLDQCIGERNHRAFISLIFLFLFCSIYSLHLSLTTICTPIMLFDFLLFPNDCRFVYSDLLGAIAYVSCCYTIVGVVLVLLLLFQQMIFICQNVTLQEYKHYQKLNHSSNWLSRIVIPNNLYNKGLKYNLTVFFHRIRGHPHIGGEESEDES